MYFQFLLFHFFTVLYVCRFISQLQYFQVAGKGGAGSTIEAGIRATAQLLGEDVGKEVRLSCNIF